MSGPPLSRCRPPPDPLPCGRFHGFSLQLQPSSPASSSMKQLSSPMAPGVTASLLRLPSPRLRLRPPPDPSPCSSAPVPFECLFPPEPPDPPDASLKLAIHLTRVGSDEKHAARKYPTSLFSPQTPFSYTPTVTGVDPQCSSQNHHTPLAPSSAKTVGHERSFPHVLLLLGEKTTTKSLLYSAVYVSAEDQDVIETVYSAGMSDISKNRWLRHGNVDSRSLCLTSATASPSNTVKLINLYAVMKVARPSLPGLKHPPLATTIHVQQLSRSLTSTHVHVRLTQSLARSQSLLVVCSPVALLQKVNQTSSCRGHERSFSPVLLFVGSEVQSKFHVYFAGPRTEGITLIKQPSTATKITSSSTPLIHSPERQKLVSNSPVTLTILVKFIQTSSRQGRERSLSTSSSKERIVPSKSLFTRGDPLLSSSPLGERITPPCSLYYRGETYTLFLQVLKSSALVLTLRMFYDHIMVLGLKKVDFNSTSLQISTYGSFGDWLLIVCDLVVAGVLFTTWNPSMKSSGLSWISEDACSSSSHLATASFVASPFTAETLALRNAMISARQCGIPVNLWTHLGSVSFSLSISSENLSALSYCS